MPNMVKFTMVFKIYIIISKWCLAFLVLDRAKNTKNKDGAVYVKKVGNCAVSVDVFALDDDDGKVNSRGGCESWVRKVVREVGGWVDFGRVFGGPRSRVGGGVRGKAGVHGIIF